MRNMRGAIELSFTWSFATLDSSWRQIPGPFDIDG